MGDQKVMPGGLLVLSQESSAFSYRLHGHYSESRDMVSLGLYFLVLSWTLTDLIDLGRSLPSSLVFSLLEI